MSSRLSSEFATSLFEARPSATRFELTAPEIANVKRGESGNLVRLQNAKRLGTIVDVVTRNERVRSVVYLASGYDASTAFVVFPDATTIIGVDQHPFVIQPSNPIHVEKPRDNHSVWTIWSQVDEVNSTVTAILGRLTTEIRHFRLRRVVAYQEPAQRLLVAAPKFQGNQFETVERIVSHGVIEFDTGPDTPIRTYIHIDSGIPKDPQSVEARWWAGAVMGFHADALFVKAAMNVYSTAELFTPKTLGSQIAASIARHGGFIVDGDRVPWPWQPTVTQPTTINLGYKHVTIYKFKPN